MRRWRRRSSSSGRTTASTTMRPPTPWNCAVRYLMELDGFEFEYGFTSDKEYEQYSEQYDQAYAAARQELYIGGYDVYTSLDPEQQEYLQKAIDEGLSFDDETSSDGVYALQGAATLIDNETGKVTAIVGGRSQETDVYGLNRAYQSFRQPGSSIKPLIVYAPALENGYGSTTIVKDVNVDAAKAAGENADMSRLPGGTMTLRQAVERSRNGRRLVRVRRHHPRGGHGFPDEDALRQHCGGGTTIWPPAWAVSPTASPARRWPGPTPLWPTAACTGTHLHCLHEG